MAIIKLIFIFLFIYFSPCLCNASDSSKACFDRMGNADLPFDVYFEVPNSLGGNRVFLQKPKTPNDVTELSDDAISFINPVSEIQFARLCDGNFIVVWKYEHERFPVPLSGRIFNSEFKVLRDNILISKSDAEDEWEVSVSPIYDGGFVVTWKAWEPYDKPEQKRDIKIMGRVFESSGMTRGSSFNVSTMRGNNFRANVKGLPEGGFIVSWGRFNDGIYVRFFDSFGKPRTEQILVASWPNPQKELECGIFQPYPYITGKGMINIFMRCSTISLYREFIVYARTYDSDGKPVTDKVKGETIKTFEGYSQVVEEIVHPQVKIIKK